MFHFPDSDTGYYDAEERFYELDNDLSVTVDRVAIKAAIEAGIDVPGANLITDKTTLGRK
jgi:hypothetical protein